MRSRWFHVPILHILGEDKRASWLELFFDLIFVAAFIQLGNELSSHINTAGFLGFAGMFVPLWVAWTGFTFFENRFNVDDFVHRIFVFLQMFAVGGMAIGAPLVLAGEIEPFAVSAGCAQLLVGFMYVRAHRQVPEAGGYCLYWGAVFVVAGGAWLASALLPPEPAIAVWVIASVVVLVAPMSKQSRALRERFPIDMHHLGERYGILTVIVLGESFVKVLGSLVAEHAGILLYSKAAVVLLITCGIWWVYFDDVAGSRVRRGRGQWMVWLYSHIPLQIGIIAVGVGITKAVHFTFDAPAPDGYRWLLAGTLAMVYFSVAAIDSVTERRQAELSDRARVNSRWISGVLLLVLAPAGNTMSGGLFLTLVAAVNIFQVVFDMMMAPLEEHAPAEAGKRQLADAARERAPGAADRPRRDVSEAVRKGTPSELRRDLYFYFIEGSWTRVFVTLGIIFVLVNVFFASLYVLEPGSIANARADSFIDAFFFSVQTMSTIGYGSMSPLTEYGNAIVTAEAALSMIGLAIVTGFVFAKASRPKAAVIFSRPVIVTRRHGKLTMMFRAGNARGNDIVDATIDFAAVVEEISPEGHHLRRIHDLKLVRPRTPLFALSWLAMHELDAHSPLHEVDWEQPEQTIVALIATLVGHDGTYNQTVFARHVWYCEDIRMDHQFVDILSELEDGRLMIDYALFHDTKPANAPVEGTDS